MHDFVLNVYSLLSVVFVFVIVPFLVVFYTTGISIPLVTIQLKVHE